MTPRQWLGEQVHHAARAGLLDSHPFHGGMKPYVGSLWFCLRRDVCEYLVAREESRSVAYLKRLKVCEEVVFPTLLGNSGFGVVPSNHLVNDFIGPHPRPFEQSDLETLAQSEKFFARKFQGDPNHPIRQSILKQLRRREQD